MKWLKGWEELKEASAKRRLAEAHATIAEAGILSTQWEASVNEMIREINKTLTDAKMQNPKSNLTIDSVRLSPGDDPEIFYEAMRRIKKSG